MQDRTRSRTRPVEEIEEDEILGDGLVAKLADHVFENPAMSGGLFVMALTAAAIVSNAMMMQNGRHPDPLFMTRPAPAAHAPVPLPRVRSEAAAKPAAPVPVPRQAPATPATTAAAAPVAAPRLVAEVQHALAVRRLYAGAADGIAGSRTRAAISAYEKSAGLPVTGLASADLLARLKAPAKLATAKPAAAPALPAAAPVAIAAAPQTSSPAAAASASAAALPQPGAAPVRPLSTPPVAERHALAPAPAPAPAAPLPEPAAPVVEDDPTIGVAPASPPAAGPDPAPAVALDPPAAAEPVPPAAPAATAAPVDETLVPTPAAAPSLLEHQRYRRVQDALNQAGYGPLATDGNANEETASAIRRFELDNGLPLTGKPGDRVVARLVAIGAMAAN